MSDHKNWWKKNEIEVVLPEVVIDDTSELNMGTGTTYVIHLCDENAKVVRSERHQGIIPYYNAIFIKPEGLKS